MIYLLEPNNYHKVLPLLKNTLYELSVLAVIVGNAPGEVYVDEVNHPKSTLIMSPECNLVAGYSGNKEFNAGVKSKLDFFDQITCDTEEWEKNINEIHRNVAIRKYKRRYYLFNDLTHKEPTYNLDKQFILEYVNTENLEKIDYENNHLIKDWFKLNDLSQFKDYCLGTYIRHRNKIVSCSLVDCIVEDKIEIGVKTIKEYKGRGLGTIVAEATVNASIENGIKQIGWHCVDSNIGSIRIAEKVGFKKQIDYHSFTPYPPIENITDLSQEEWTNWALFYEEKNTIVPYYYLSAALCFANARNLIKTIENIQKLAETGETWFVKYLKQDEFTVFSTEEEWMKLLEEVSKLE